MVLVDHFGKWNSDNKLRADILKVLLTIPDLDDNTKSGEFTRSPLHNAIISQNKQAVEVLLQTLENEDETQRVDVNVKDANGMTPLHMACQVGNTEIVETILQKLSCGDNERLFDINAKDHKGRSPMVVAKEHSQVDIISLLTNS